MAKYIILLLFSVTIISCASKKQYADNASKLYYYNTPFSSVNGDSFEKRKLFNDGSLEDKQRKEFDNRKIIYNAFLSIITKTPDTATKELTKIAKKYQGYIQQSGNNRTIIRVKSDYLNDAINSISKLGKVQYKSITSQDITDEYEDLGIRLENANKTRKRYQDLLNKAEVVDEILKIEKELERLNTEIDLLKGKMTRYDHLSSYSTISVDVKENIKPGLLGFIGLGLYHSVKWLFVRN